MITEKPESEPHDAHIQLAHKIFRDVGWSLDAMQFPRSPEALKALRKFNGVPDDWQNPFAWNYHPNKWCQDNWKKYLKGSQHD